MRVCSLGSKLKMDGQGKVALKDGMLGLGKMSTLFIWIMWQLWGGEWHVPICTWQWANDMECSIGRWMNNQMFTWKRTNGKRMTTVSKGWRGKHYCEAWNGVFSTISSKKSLYVKLYRLLNFTGCTLYTISTFFFEKFFTFAQIHFTYEVCFLGE